jgi:hypothetical protein
VIAPFALAPEHTGRSESDMAELAHAPDAVEAQRTRARLCLADVIFKALCLVTAGLLIVVFGILGVSVGVVLYFIY